MMAFRLLPLPSLPSLLLAAGIVLTGCVQERAMQTAEREVADEGPRTAGHRVIDAEEIRASGAQTLKELLASRVSGVRMEGRAVHLRGRSSVHGGGPPLYVVDGVPLREAPMLHADDLASVEILKGAAAARYGIRGGNGVIVITTRHE